ncbi:tRNA (guanosine(37)-N1)-methyltransferase TrmD [Candidatus Gottesmanbacteria bacterium]|nr:tRNA (guanosine(37)-N1)-methyltransferase TrmD [Candidatus Gottesmanbacteria bacterium]
MKFSILTLFPEMFIGPFDSSIVKRAKEKGLVTIDFVNIRDFATDTYKSVDDHPYGGGGGMVLRVDIVDAALKKLKGKKVLLDPRGERYSQKKAREYSKLDHLILICGHYEGVDERVKSLVDESISIGDYVLTGGEIPAMVIIDSVTRLIPGVLKKEEATRSESFTQTGVLEYPQYTRPEVYKGMNVPDILLSGDHKKIAEWRKASSGKRVFFVTKHRPLGR